MDDASSVRSDDGIGERGGDVEEPIERESVPGQKLREGLALDELHRHEVDAVRFLDGVDRHDVRVIQRRERFRLALEAGPPLLAIREIVRQHLESDLAVELGILGEIDVSHPARTELLQDFVVRDRTTKHPTRKLAYHRLDDDFALRQDLAPLAASRALT